MGGLRLIGIKKAFVPKEEVISTNLETVYMVVNFLLSIGILDLKTKHIVC